MDGNRQESTTVKNEANSTMCATSTPSAIDTNSSSFKPQMINADAPTTSIAQSATLDAILQVEKLPEKDEICNFVDMYWIDAYENNGVVHLYGKVEVPDKNGNASSFVSCCAVVRNNQHNLYVLPRKKTDGSGEFESMMDVHNEMKSILQPSCIPHVQGATWGGKIVKRKYAFGDVDVPRDEQQYLKVVYDAK